MDWFDNLRTLKANSNMSMREIAIKSGIPEPTLEKIFSGATKSPGINTIQSLVHALGYTLDDIDPAPNKNAPLYSSEAEKLAQDYDTLDSYGKRVVRLVVDAEKVRCVEQAQFSKVIKIAGRDGSFTEIRLTDNQIKDLRAHIDQLPDPGDDL